MTPWTAACQASLSLTTSRSLPKFMPTESVMPSNHLILCRPLLLLPSVFPSIRVFSNESVLRIRWLKYWSFNFSISPSNEYSGLISFKINWFDLPPSNEYSGLISFKINWFDLPRDSQESSPAPALKCFPLGKYLRFWPQAICKQMSDVATFLLLKSKIAARFTYSVDQ